MKYRGLSHVIRIKMILIALTQGYLAQIDDEDYERVSQHKWHAAVMRSGVCAMSNRVLMHRFILGVYDPHILVDHRNGDQLDNRRENLRIATNKQNAENRKPDARSTTGVRNVTRTLNGKYQVRVKHNYVIHNFGTYDTIEEAERVAIAARQKLFTHSTD